MYARHDLAWLTAEGWLQLQAAMPPGAPAHAAIRRWSAAGWPLVVRRPDMVSAAGASSSALAAGEIFLGLAAPPDAASGAKLRLPLRVPACHVERSSPPLPLAQVAHALPPAWQAPFARLADASAGFELRVFGSLALQALTGQAYLRESSDIDLLFRPRGIPELEAGARLLAAHLGQLPLDGEIVFPSGRAVAWKEWLASRDDGARVLVKSHAGVKLDTRAALRAELEPV